MTGRLLRASFWMRWGAVLALCGTLSACTFPGLPSSEDPSCSWSTTIPSNAESLCTIAHDTLNRVVQAQITGDHPAVRALVTAPAVERRIWTFGQQLRAEGIVDVHLVPSLTLEQTPTGLLGAAFHVAVKTDKRRQSTPETVFMRVRGRHAVVVADQPEQEW